MSVETRDLVGEIRRDETKFEGPDRPRSNFLPSLSIASMVNMSSKTMYDVADAIVLSMCPGLDKYRTSFNFARSTATLRPRCLRVFPRVYLLGSSSFVLVLSLLPIDIRFVWWYGGLW